ncbi:MAG TPA: 4Fe-4S dicluster domain-containing protein [Planctomycetes bacterium]|jgi:Fe-S-cluster-containing dehydrogenase component|nr:4Fe-4S dicluster domain-containing protein [Planctomycetota bacterium]
MSKKQRPPSPEKEELSPKGLSRRAMMKGAGATVGAAALVVAAAPALKEVAGLTLEEFLQKHYKELGPDDVAELIARLESEQLEKHGVHSSISDLKPIDGVKFGYAINLSVCNGNGKCVEACHRENNHDRDTNQSYIRVLEMERGSIDMEKGNTTYNHAVPAKDKYYLPVQCQQCDNPPCVSVCPTEATWKETDGIVVVDYNWCIGCRYCEAACPYHARRFNWKESTLPSDEINEEQGLLSNRPRPVGVVEKCHFCLHKTRKGEIPACAEACPTGARVFGNLNDPESDLRWILANKRCFVLKEELGTKPSFFYYFDE